MRRPRQPLHDWQGSRSTTWRWLARLRPSSPVRAALALLLAFALTSSSPTSPAAAQPATRTVPSVPLLAGVTPIGAPATAAIPPTGGQLTFGDGMLTVQAFADPARTPVTFVYQAVDARTLPPAQSGLSLGFGAFQLSAVNDQGTALVSSFNVPVNLVIAPGGSDLALGLGRLDRLYVGSWNGSTWVAVPCSTDAVTGTRLVCSVTQPGLFVPLVALPINPSLGRLDYQVEGGHFYTQGNGFGGGGGLGFAVVDDGDAAMWSEFQRLGGVRRLGFPVSQRFLYAGAVTQAFQRGALQWAPEFGQSVPLNIMDELHAHGSDGWLDSTRQIPAAPPDGNPADPSILSPFPTILATYQADPELYGLPVSVKDYGQLGSARFQRSTLQVWQQDQPSAAAGDVIPGQPGDLASAGGLWPVSATTPAGPPAS